jgi:hypothetical protein
MMSTKQYESGKSLDTALGIIMFILGIMLLGLDIIIISNACQKYKRENHHLTMKDIEPILSDLIPKILLQIEEYIRNCIIEESRIMTENGLDSNATV